LVPAVTVSELLASAPLAIEPAVMLAPLRLVRSEPLAVMVLVPMFMLPKPLPLVRLELVIRPLTKAEPLYCKTCPLAMELMVRVVPCNLAMVGLG